MENTHQFIIHLHCVRDVEDFVALATSQNFPVSLDDGQHKVNGKSFMEMFCLILTRPLRVTAVCDVDTFLPFWQDAARFIED